MVGGARLFAGARLLEVLNSYRSALPVGAVSSHRCIMVSLYGNLGIIVVDM